MLLEDTTDSVRVCQVIRIICMVILVRDRRDSIRDSIRDSVRDSIRASIREHQLMPINVDSLVSRTGLAMNAKQLFSRPHLEHLSEEMPSALLYEWESE